MWKDNKRPTQYTNSRSSSMLNAVAIPKNLHHSQDIDFQAFPSDPYQCFGRAALRVISRFKLLYNRPNTPVAIYLHITDSKTCNCLVKLSGKLKLQLAAWKVFYPDGSWDESLTETTAHSFWIQVAVMLFESNAPESLIIGRLRYLSNCYSMYYRNILVPAKLHAVAVERLVWINSHQKQVKLIPTLRENHQKYQSNVQLISFLICSHFNIEPVVQHNSNIILLSNQTCTTQMSFLCQNQTFTTQIFKEYSIVVDTYYGHLISK